MAILPSILGACRVLHCHKHRSISIGLLACWVPVRGKMSWLQYEIGKVSTPYIYRYRPTYIDRWTSVSSYKDRHDAYLRPLIRSSIAPSSESLGSPSPISMSCIVQPMIYVRSYFRSNTCMIDRYHAFVNTPLRFGWRTSSWGTYQCRHSQSKCEWVFTRSSKTFFLPSYLNRSSCSWSRFLHQLVSFLIPATEQILKGRCVKQRTL